MPIRKYNPDDYRVIGGASIGHNSAVSDFKMDESTGIEYHMVIQDLRNIMNKILPNWCTINLEVKEEISDSK